MITAFILAAVGLMMLTLKKTFSSAIVGVQFLGWSGLLLFINVKQPLFAFLIQILMMAQIFFGWTLLTRVYVARKDSDLNVLDRLNQ